MSTDNFKENSVLLSGILVTLLLVGLAVGQTNYDVITFDVNISETTILDVNPNTTSWYGLSIGQTSGDRAFIVENIGSKAIVTIDSNVTYNTSNPYGASNANAFDAGDFVVMNSSNVSGGTMFYIAKREFSETKPDYVTAPSGWVAGANTGTFGKFKTTSGSDGIEYFWMLNKTVGDQAGNCSNGTLYIAKNRHTRSETGDVDFSNTGNRTAITLSTNTGAYGFGNTTGVTNGLESYCVRVNYDCQWVEFFHWNNGLDAASACNNEKYLWSGDSLNPGQKFTVYLQAKIPFGVAAGTASTGTISLIASAA